MPERVQTGPLRMIYEHDKGCDRHPPQSVHNEEIVRPEPDISRPHTHECDAQRPQAHSHLYPGMKSKFQISKQSNRLKMDASSLRLTPK